MPIKVRRGYGPQEPNRLIPGIYLNPRVSDEAFGAGLGRGLQQLAAGLQARQAELDRAKSATNDFAAKKAYIEEATSLQSDLQRRMQEAPLGAEGLTDRILTDYTERHGQLLTRLREQGIDEKNLQEMDLRLSSLRQSAAGQTLNFQEQSQRTKVGQEVGEVGSNLSRMLLNDPDLIEDADRELRSAIDSLPVDAVTKGKLYEENKDLINMSAVLGVAEHDPERIIRAMQPREVPLDEATFVQRMKTSVAKVETGHHRSEYQAQGPLVNGDRAYGKYQVMGNNIARWTKQATGKASTPAEFLTDPALQEAVFEDQMGSLYKKHGNARDAASVWFTGVPYEQAVKEGRHDGNLSVEQYVARVEGGSPTTGALGDPVLDRLDARQQLQAYNAAQTNMNQLQAAFKADLSVRRENAETALLTTGQYDGELPTREEFDAAYGFGAEQEWAKWEGTLRVADAIDTMKTDSPDEMQRKVEALRPTDTESTTYAREQEAFEAAAKARDTLITQRTDDPAAYAAQNFPAVQEQAQLAAEQPTPENLRSMFRGLAEAYTQLGIHPTDWKAFPVAAVQAYKAQFEAMAPEQQLSHLAELWTTAGDLLPAALEQLAVEGLGTEVYLTGLVVESPEHMAVAADVLRGKHIMETEPQRGPRGEEVNEVWRDELGVALQGMRSETNAAMLDAAKSLYTFRFGHEEDFNEAGFRTALREVMGGTADDDTTGLQNIGTLNLLGFRGGTDPVKTLLPVGVNTEQFVTWLDQVDDEQLGSLSLSGLGPVYATGDSVPADDISNYGTLRRVGPFEYDVIMRTDGEFLTDRNGDRFILRLNKDVVLDLAPFRPILTYPDAPGIIEKGNVDLNARPSVQLNGKTATLRSASFNIDGVEVLVPTISDDGRVLSESEAIEHYRQTGKHLGKFKTPEAATAYAKRLSKEQGTRYGPLR